MIEVTEIWENVVRGGQRPLLITPRRTYTYQDFRSLVRRAGLALQANKPTAGDRVMILLEDEALAAAAFIASILSGLVPAMLPFDVGIHRRESIRRLLEPVLVVDDERLLDEDDGKLPSLADQAPDQLAYLIFTSGTTGEPSGVEITKANLFSHLATLRRLFGFDSETRIFNPTPLSHTDGLIFGLMLAVSTGGSVIRPGPLNLPDFENWIGMLQEHRATHMITNPTVLSLMDRVSRENSYFRIEGFKGIISSASLLRPEAWRHFEERFGTEIWNLYGLTETVTSALYAGRHPEMGAVGSLGKPIDCEARLAPLSGNLGQSEQADVGELELKGDHIFRGYWKNPARTASTFTSDHWMRTGDLVRMRDDGSFEFLGRLKSAINSGGTLIRGEEIDECLLRHPAVLESVTVGIGDDDFEEIAVSAVVLSGGVSEADLTEHCRAGLERLKVPKRIVALSSIPRGDAGKPNLEALRRLVSGMLDHTDKPESARMDSPHQQVLELAALIFRTDATELSLGSSAETVEGWDSFTHINLILQAEEEFGIRIPGDQISEIRTLSDLNDKIVELRKVGAA